MKFHKCEDGKFRTRILVPMYFTAEEIAKLKRMAKANSDKSFREMCGSLGQLGVEGDMDNFEEEME